MPAVRFRSAKLAAMAVGLVAMGAVATGPALAGDDHGPGGPDPTDQSSDARPTNAAANSTVNFRQGALFSCFGADGTGIAAPSTANITANATTVTAVVTVRAAPFTTIFGQLTQSGCARLKFFTVSVGASGTKTETVSDLRVSNDAFVWFVSSGGGSLQITPEVVFTTPRK
jgi:hypothetical protein